MGFFIIINWSNIMDAFDAQALQKKYERWHELHEQIQGAQEK